MHLEVWPLVAKPDKHVLDEMAKVRDIVSLARPRIVPLPFGKGRLGKFVLPAKLVPVSHCKTQREHALVGGDRVQIGIGGRAGRAALALVKFDHHRMAVVSSRAR